MTQGQAWSFVPRAARAAIDADALSPREALELIYRLKGLAGEGERT